MTNGELLDKLAYGLTAYRKDTGHTIDLITYFSLTDLSFDEVLTMASSEHRRRLQLKLIEYKESNYWLLKKIDLPKKIRLFHSIKGHELTEDEKIAICAKIKMENFPFVEGVFDCAARIYINNGLDCISKEKIRADFDELYYKRYGKDIGKGKVLVKKATTNHS